MKAVLQRVINASVTVDGQVISSIGKGLLILVGIDRNDTPEDRSTLIKRILSVKLFDDPNGGAWKRNIKDIEGEILCVSQFTLLAQFKGTKPDFHESMSTIPGKAFYGAFMDEMKAAYAGDKIQDGQFGAMMQVSLTNDGPVTVSISSTDSRRGKDKPRIPTESVGGSGTQPPEGSGQGAAKKDKKNGRAGSGPSVKEDGPGEAATGASTPAWDSSAAPSGVTTPAD